MADDPIHSGPRDEILNPRGVYDRDGEDALRERLEALDRDTVEEVVRAHPPHHTAPPALETMDDDELIGYIVDGVKRQAS